VWNLVKVVKAYGCPSKNGNIGSTEPVQQPSAQCEIIVFCCIRNPFTAYYPVVVRDAVGWEPYQKEPGDNKNF
jgi:hypothetical protein